MTDPRIIELRTLGASIADGVYFGPDVYVEKEFARLLTIDRGATLSQGVTLLLHDSSLNNVAGAAIEFAPVHLGENCYLGANSTVLCDVRVGAGALVGAGAVVTRDVPAGAVALGVPARVVSTVAEAVERQARRRKDSLRREYLKTPPWRSRSDEDNIELAARISTLIKDMSRRVGGPNE